MFVHRNSKTQIINSDSWPHSWVFGVETHNQALVVSGTDVDHGLAVTHYHSLAIAGGRGFRGGDKEEERKRM